MSLQDRENSDSTHSQESHHTHSIINQKCNLNVSRPVELLAVGFSFFFFDILTRKEGISV